jgi:multisubunit Na+/H+ antiporter MnhB subunit
MVDSIDKVEGWVKSIERFMVVLAVAIILLILSYRIAEKSNNGLFVLIIGVCLILVMVLIEVLLLERHKHQHR